MVCGQRKQLTADVTDGSEWESGKIVTDSKDHSAHCVPVVGGPARNWSAETILPREGAKR